MVSRTPLGSWSGQREAPAGGHQVSAPARAPLGSPLTGEWHSASRSISIPQVVKKIYSTNLNEQCMLLSITQSNICAVKCQVHCNKGHTRRSCIQVRSHSSYSQSLLLRNRLFHVFLLVYFHLLVSDCPKLSQQGSCHSMHPPNIFILVMQYIIHKRTIVG
jgi:hypothetical protein